LRGRVSPGQLLLAAIVLGAVVFVVFTALGKAGY
jgi:hypothetical protein